MALYKKRCLICQREFQLDTPEEPIPPHERLDEPDLECSGGGEDGELVGEDPY